MKSRPLSSKAYPKRHLRFAGGRLVAYGTNGGFAGQQ